MKPNVIFDMDGVIVNSEPVIMKAAKDALNSYGIPAEYSDFEPYIGAGEEKFIISLCEKYGKPELIDEIILKMFENFEADIDKMKVFPAAKPLIEKLVSLGHTLALVSSAARRKLSVSLKEAGIDEKNFKVVLSGSDVKEKKPSPEPYLSGAERLGVSPSDCVVIEDAISGVKSAKAAGMECIAVTTSFKADALIDAGADRVVSDLTEILEELQPRSAVLHNGNILD